MVRQSKSFARSLVAVAFLSTQFIGPFVSSLQACDPTGQTGFFPKNNLLIPADQKNATGISKEAALEVLAKLKNIYGPDFETNGTELVTVLDWNNPEVNAYAEPKLDKRLITLTGGLARHELMTKDGFALVACHELGHHIGGAPKKTGIWDTWASSEGQSDYFASLKCMRRYLADENNSEFVKTNVESSMNAVVKEKCNASFSNPEDVALCVRNSYAGLTLAEVLFTLESKTLPPERIVKVNFTTPDPAVVQRNFEKHPKAQCRLDTYFQGSICSVSFNEQVSQRDYKVGTCTKEESYTTGLRPACWFAGKQ